MPPGVPFWFFGPVRRGCRWFGLTADAAADYALAVSPRRGLICPWRGAWPTACALPALSLGLVLREAQEQGSEPRLQAPGPGSAGAGAAWPPRSLLCGDRAVSWGCVAPCPRGAPLGRALSSGRPALVDVLSPRPSGAFLVLQPPLHARTPGLERHLRVRLLFFFFSMIFGILVVVRISTQNVLVCTQLLLGIGSLKSHVPVILF